MKRAPGRSSSAAALSGLHDAALLSAVFYAPILWGQVSIAETGGAGQMSASGGLALIGGLVFLALLSALLARWAAGAPPARLPNAVHLPAALLIVVAAISTISSVNRHASIIELSRLLVGFCLFYLVANRAALPAARPGVVAFAFACSLVLSALSPMPSGAGMDLRMFTVVATGIGVAVVLTQRDRQDAVAWLRSMLILSAALVVGLHGLREKLAVFRELRNETWAIFSTFFNPNSLAGFLAMACPLAISAAIADRTLWRRLLWVFCAVVLVAAVLPTKSKGGMVALTAALLLYLILLARGRPRLRRPAGMVVVAGAIALLVIAIVSWQLPSARAWFVDTLRLDSPSNMFRVLTWQGTVRLFEAYPWLGAGPGVFKYVYPKYAIAGYTEAAHQNYLQMFAELGVAGGLAFLWLFGAVLYTGARALASAEPTKRTYAIGGICAVVVLMLHSLLDYDWYVGAINFSFWLIVGAMVNFASASPAQAVETLPAAKRGRRRPAAAPEPAEAALPGKPFPWLTHRPRAGWVVLLTAALLVAWFAIEAPLRNALAQPVIETGDAYATSGSRDAGEMSLAQYDRARQLDPRWSEAWEKYGLVLGTMRGLAQGIEALERAHQLSPTSFRPLSSMGQLYREYGDLPEAIRYYQQSLALYPNRTLTLRWLAEAYSQQGQQDKALDTYSRLVAGEQALFHKYPALGDIEVDTNFAFAHYELGRAAQQARDYGTALKHFDETVKIVADYFARAQRTDEMYRMLGRPREYRAPEMERLEAKTRWRESMIYRRTGDVKDEEWERNRALAIYPEVAQAVATEDGQQPAPGSR
ncbi:MAG: O-antigen ligase family protein [Armatimonadota bacterium]